MLEQGAELNGSVPTRVANVTASGETAPQGPPSSQLTTHCCSWSGPPPGGYRAPHPPAPERSSAEAPTTGRRSRGSLPVTHRDRMGVSSGQQPPLHPCHTGSAYLYSPCICNATGHSRQPSQSGQPLAGSSSGPGHCRVVGNVSGMCQPGRATAGWFGSQA